ncbi:MAG: outer membrane protein [Hyphomicrobiaceae bacterium]
MLRALRTKGGAALVGLGLAFSSPSFAADLPGYRGSLDPGPPVHHYTVGSCYVRADVGYSRAVVPNVRWPVFNGAFVGEHVADVEIDDSWLGDIGVGCGAGSRGMRAELALGLRGAQDLDGTPLAVGANPIDPLHTTVSSYTMMFNVYRDLGYWGKTVPYVGLGIGVAFNELDDVSFSRIPPVNNTIRGDDELSFAWSLMAGFAHQISSRAVVDFGYRYIDLGSVRSGRIDTALNQQSAVRVDDLAAHEFKIGLRYYLGAVAPGPGALK